MVFLVGMLVMLSASQLAIAVDLVIVNEDVSVYRQAIHDQIMSLIALGMEGQMLDKPDGIFAAQTWCAVADSTVADKFAKAFETVSLARDQALVLITDRNRKQRPVTGADVDQATRAYIKKAGNGDQVMHRTGHSIDSDLQGGGADLDDFEVKDTRILTPGTGFTVGPGVYFPTQFGVRTEVSVYLAPSGPEVTTPPQQEIEALLK